MQDLGALSDEMTPVLTDWLRGAQPEPLRLFQLRTVSRSATRSLTTLEQGH